MKKREKESFLPCEALALLTKFPVAGSNMGVGE